MVPQGIRVSIITSVFKGDAYIAGFFEDITRQSYFEYSELLLGVVEPVSDHVSNMIKKQQAIHKNIHVIPFKNNESLYLVWNDLIRKSAKGEYIINANLDDRHHPDCIKIFAEFLDDHLDAYVVAASIKVSSDPDVSWDKSADYSEWWKVDTPFRLTILDFFKFDAYDRITTTQNLPHRFVLQYLSKCSSPMWRKSYHDQHGYFDENLSPISDWEFWMRGSAHDAHMWFLNQTLSVYTVNPSSYGRKGATIDQKVSDVMAEYEGLLECRSLNILIVHERVPILYEGGDRRIWEIIKWLHSKGHRIHYISRMDNRYQAPESMKFFESIGARVHAGDLKLEKMNQWLSHTSQPFDLALLATWYAFISENL